MTEPQGAKLKQIRLQKGYSLEEVQKKTKIHPNILKAIEEDNLVNISPIYMRGFLKIYCRVLEVDPREFIPDYKEPRETVRFMPAEIKLANMESPPGFMKTVSRAVGVIRPYIKIKKMVLVAAIILGIVGLFSFGRFVASKRSSRNPKEKLSAPAVEKKKPAAASKQEKPAVVSSADRQTQPKHTEEQTSPPVTSGIRLIIRAKEDCYIQLKTDGHTVFQSILKKGRFETWHAKDKIEFSLGNAGAVALEVNGRTISNIGRRGYAVKNILITKEGLTIP